MIEYGITVDGLALFTLMGFLSLLVFHAHIKNKLFEIEEKVEALNDD